MGRLWRRWFRSKRGQDLERLRGRYRRFQHLIDGNNQVLELIADAGEKLGGDYLFDHRYLESVVDELDQVVSEVVVDLNAFTDGRHLELMEVLEGIRARVRAVLTPDEPVGIDLVLPMEQIDEDDTPTVGEKMSSLGEIHRRLGLSVPEGFVATAAACRRQFQSRGLDRLIAALAEEVKTAAADEVEAVSARLQRAVREAPLDRWVARSLRKALKRPQGADWTYAVRSSALGEDGEHSFAGQHATFLNVRPADVLEAYRNVLASLFSPEAVRYRLEKGLAIADALMAVGFLSLIPARASGVVHTVDPSSPRKGTMVVDSALGLGPTVVQGTGPADRFELSRDPSPRVLSRRIAKKELQLRPAKEGGTELVSVEEGRQSAASVSDAELAELGRIALQIERHAKQPQEIEWAVTPDERIVVLQARRLRVASLEHGDEVGGAELSRALAGRKVLLRGKGVIACRGIAAGPVVRVRSTEDIRDFPFGGVLVAQSTSPHYASLLAKASAVVTDVGSSTGHLATVAREFRVPMLVNVEEATHVLPSGAEITVDAEENVVYDGVVQELLQYHLYYEPRDLDFWEFRLLRRLLRRVAPLHLTDPDSETFRARFCSTYHDVVRFAHEMAVRELVDMPGLASRDRKRFVRRLRLDVPMDLDLLDLGGGVRPGADAPLVIPDHIESAPLAALLRGLRGPGAWRTEPVDMDMESFLASATRSASFAVADTTRVRPNIAVISKDYMNLHLLLGYHFNMVDSRLSEDPGANYIYFRFTGGVTDITRRSRRARLIAAILQEYDFGVETKGDLVIGRLRDLGSKAMGERLEMLGRLIGFTRQLDVLMRDEEMVLEWAREFVGREPASFQGLPAAEKANTL